MATKLPEENRFMANVDYVVAGLESAAGIADETTQRLLQHYIQMLRYDPVQAAQQALVIPTILNSQISATNNQELQSKLSAASERFTLARENLNILAQSPLAYLVREMGIIASDVDEGGDFPGISGTVPGLVTEIRQMITNLPNGLGEGKQAITHLEHLLLANPKTAFLVQRLSHVRDEIQHLLTGSD